MPWKESSSMSLRYEFVTFALCHGSNMRELCRRFEISPKTGYKWRSRYLQENIKGLKDRSKRPHTSPERTADKIEKSILAVRDEHPAWGGRNIRRILLESEFPCAPAPSTITDILSRHGRIKPEDSSPHKAWKRFEHEEPNLLWQMDFKGDFPLESGGRCYPLTVLDDHSRFSICLKACSDEKRSTVQPLLTDTFRRYGLPERMIMDNGSPWGGKGGYTFTHLTVWLIRLGIYVGHSQPYHPQTLGKDERFHRTLKVEVLANHVFHDLMYCQKKFDDWRDVYNTIRPHEALGMKTPVKFYHPSLHQFPEVIEPIEYGPGDVVRKVQSKGEIFYKGRPFRVGAAFHGHPVALRHTDEDGVMNVIFCHQKVAQINLNDP
jgi:transposase InsO family protein